MAGVLYLCATPIGNLGDITERVIETLGRVDLIAAEDTRNSLRLLNHFGIKTPMTSYHEHNKYDKAVILVNRLIAGQNIALITDAGTPGISDPGEILVNMCHEQGINVTSLPGPVALIVALTMSGLPTRRFVFEGFLPQDKRERKQVLEDISKETRTIILYEAPHHLRATLKELLDTIGDREIALCRELTKKFEEVKRLKLSKAIDYYEENDPRGEYVICIRGQDIKEIVRQKQEKYQEMDLSSHMDIYLAQGLDEKESMKRVAKDRGISKRDVYREIHGD